MNAGWRSEITRLRDSLTAALAVPPAGCRSLAIAYSGGLDSSVLLHVLSTGGPALPLRALHVCHHLEGQARDWALFCARQCRAYGIEYSSLDVAVDTRGGGLEAAAREARYRALAAVLQPGELLITAHHADDQAETFLLQALRGAGPAGLAAMPVYRRLGAGGHWRPWLAIERARLTDYARARGLAWINDPSNRQTAHDRAYLRHTIWPVFEQRWPAAARTLGRSARWAGQASEAIAALAAIDLAAVQAADGALLAAELAGLSCPRRAQVLRRWLAGQGRDRPDHRHVEAIAALKFARLRASPCVAYADSEVRLFDGRLYAMPRLGAPPRRDLIWRMRQPLVLPGDAGVLSAALTTGSVQAGQRLRVGFRRGGERLARRDGSTCKLKDYLREARIPPWVRERIPLLYAEGELIAVADRWRHPWLDSRPGPYKPRFVWQHNLPGDRARVVANPGLV